MTIALVAFSISVCATIVGATLAPAAKTGAKPTVTASQTNRPAPSTTGTAVRPPLQMGISYGDTLTWMDDKDRAAGLDDAVTVGARWIRVDLSWADIQPDGPTRYQWPRFDRIVAAAVSRGLSVLPTIGYTPAWARSSNCQKGSSCPPANPAAFAAFASQAAARYAPKGVHTWEIWNEPNIGDFWYPTPDPAAYTRLLKATAAALRKTDPKAYLLMGGFAAVRTNAQPGFVSQTEFLTAVSKLGGNRVVDALSYHPYSYPLLPSTVTTYGTAFERISSAKDNLVAVLQKYGTPDLPIWITETGAATNGPGVAADGTVVKPNTTHVTEAYQARFTADTIATAAANPHVAAMFWFADRDSGTAAQKASRSLFFGLRHLDGTPKPAFQALKDAITAYEERKPS